MNTVILGCDSYPDYSFFIPITALVWRQRMGYQPFIFLVGDQDYWMSVPRLKAAVDGAREWSGSEIRFVRNVDELTAGMMAKIARSYGPACLPELQDRYCLTSDIDMWPVSTGWFNRDAIDGFHVFFSDAYSPEIKFPICYLGACGRNWGNLLSVASGDDLISEISKGFTYFKSWLPEHRVDRLRWDDEEWLMPFWEKIYPDRCLCVQRRTPDRGILRIDRNLEEWPKALSRRDSMIDAHLWRPGFGPSWPQYHRPLLTWLLGEISSNVESYHELWAATA